MVIVVGGGPSGSYLSYLLAKDGFKVKLLEEHKVIGKPVQCTGVVTEAIDDVLKLDESVIVNKIKTVRVHFNGDYVDVNLGKGDYILDRCGFDRYLNEMARSEGAEILMSCRLNSASFKNGKVNCDTNKGNIQDDVVVGADGPYSRVGSSFNMLNGRKYKTAIQYRVSGNFDSEIYNVYLGYGEFGWLVPENKKYARVGIVGEDNLNFEFNRLLNNLKINKKLENQTGMIPMFNFNIPLSLNNKVFLTGDAAGLVKASSHGGIVYGLNAAKILNKVLKEGGNYDKLIKKTIGKELSISLKIRQIMGCFKDEDYSYLMKLFKQEKVLNLMSQYNRDFPSKFLFKLILTEPRFLKFLKQMVI